MAYHTFAAGEYDPESPLTTQFFTDLIGNFAGLAAGDAGAPSIVQAAIGSGAIHQGQLDTTQQTASTTSASTQYFTITGGSYSFWPGYYGTDSTTGGSTFVADYSGAGITGGAYVHRFGYSADGSLSTCNVAARYVNSSPPHDFGDGQVGLIVEVVINNSTSTVESINCAPDPVWLHNGPTKTTPDFYKRQLDGSIKGFRRVREVIAQMPNVWDLINSHIDNNNMAQANSLIDRLNTDPFVDIEVDSTIKNADMNIVPHSFIGNDLSGKTVLMLDPVSTHKLLDLYQYEEGRKIIHDRLHDGKILVGNTPISRAGPAGLPIHPFTF